jgi:beta-glucosidase
MQKINGSFDLRAENFGADFKWGVAISAAQNEGAVDTDGKSPSIWDTFAKRTGKISGGGTPATGCDFYHRYKDDLLLARALGFTTFRFSISWPRVLPDGVGRINKEGILFYQRVIDECLLLGMQPCITLYHWDLPQELEKRGGWTNFLIVKWFARFVTVCADSFGDRVKQWIVLNEPFGFTALGYMMGKHAPGKRGLEYFLPAIHHATLAQAEGGRLLRKHLPQAIIGTSFSMSLVEPYTDKKEDVLAAARVDALLNRLFIEPALGKGYPADLDFPLLEKLAVSQKAWRYTNAMQFDFDFIGVQYYFPVTVRHNRLIPFVNASEVKPGYRKVPVTGMGWEINADSFYRTLKRVWHYGAVKQIIVTENGAFFKDVVKNGIIADTERIQYFQQHLQAVYRAKKEGVNIGGYYAWTLMDNFEWAMGYKARFGLVHVDAKTQLRTIKNSGYWWRDFLQHVR